MRLMVFGAHMAYMLIAPVNYTATITIVGGAGNTVPVYSTNIAYYIKTGRKCDLWIHNAGDGGAEGAGTGAFTIALPFESASTMASGDMAAGTFINGGNSAPIFAAIAASSTTMSLSYLSVGSIVAMSGAQQNNTSRTFSLHVSYMTAI